MGFGPRVHGIVRWYRPLNLPSTAKISLSWRGIFQSNPGRTGKIGRWWASGGGRQRHRPCLWRRSMGAHRRQVSGRSKAQFSMGFRPMAPQRRGKIVSLIFERWWQLATERRFGIPQWLGQLPWGQRTFMKLLGWSAWHGRQHRRGNGVGRWVRVWLRGCHKPGSRAPIYKPGTFLLMRKMDSNKPSCRIHG
jgi:hypothetical protein